MIERVIEFSSKTMPRDIVEGLFGELGEEMPQKTPTFAEICRRPSVEARDLRRFIDFECDDEALKAAVIELKYEGYLKRNNPQSTSKRDWKANLSPKTSITIQSRRCASRQDKNFPKSVRSTSVKRQEYQAYHLRTSQS